MARICFIAILFISSALNITLASGPDFHLTAWHSGLETTINCLLKDSNGFVWIGTPQGLYRFDGYDFELINTVEDNGLQLSHPFITGLFEDSAGNLWIGTANGLNVFNADRNQIRHYLFNHFQYKYITLISQFQDRIWIGTRAGFILTTHLRPQPAGEIIENLEFEAVGKQCIDKIAGLTKNSDGKVFVLSEHSEILEFDAGGELIRERELSFIGQSLQFDHSLNKILISSRFGIYTINPDLTDLQLILPFQNENAKIIKLFQVQDDDYLVFSGSDNLFYRFQPSSGSLLDYIPAFQGSIKSHQHLINQIIKNQQGFLVGTNRGLVGLNLAPSFFTRYPKPPGVGEQDLFSIRNIMRLDANRLLIGGYRGTFIFDENSHEYQTISYPQAGDQNPISYHFIRLDSQVLVATEGHGLLLLDLKNYQLSPLISSEDYQSLDKRYFPSKWSISVFRDSRNQVWLGTYGGIFKANLEKRTLELFMPGNEDVFQKTWIYDFAEDSAGNIWIGSKKGLFRYDTSKDSLSHPNISSIPDLEVMSLQIQDDVLWLGTLGEGLKAYDLLNNQVVTYTTREGLCDNYIRSITINKDGNLWLATNHGLSWFDQKIKRFKNFYEEDGLSSHIFNHKAALIDQNNQIYLGGYNGFFKINQDAAISNENNTTPILKVSKFSEYGDQYNKIIANTFHAHNHSELTIPYQDKFFTIYFSTDYLEKGKITFQYQIPEIHLKWQELKNTNFIQFAAVPPGNYELKVRGSYQGGPYSEPLLLKIHIKEALYLTWWAYTLYLGLAVGAFVMGVGLYYKKREMQHKLGIEKLYSNKLLEIDKTKSRFFSNLAHEIRTPLNLITGPAMELQKKSGTPRHQQLSRQIINNAENILSLLNQILQLNKLESESMKLSLTESDLVLLLQQTLERFQHLAFYKKIRLVFNTNLESCKMKLDAEKFRDVLNNLLSNAIKYTDSGGAIEMNLACQHDTIIVSVQDNGIGIPAGDQEHIFDRYYQSTGSARQGGMGIGLAYVKEVLNAHQGSITVESHESRGSKFIIRLPASQDVEVVYLVNKPVMAESPEFIKEKVLPKDGVANIKPKLLIIEDHLELAEYMIRSMDELFEVLHAADGQDGLQIVKDIAPQLIITDIMLPKMDGITLINRLQQDERTAKIPVIILSARNNVESKIEAYKGGAIVYLTKPFEMEELKLAAENLCKQYATVEQSPATSSINPDETFYQKFLDRISANISNSDYTINQLVKELGTSRTQLHRKVKQLTGKSPILIIRSIKMQRSYQLLSQGKNVKEVAFATGYSSTTQFKKVFKTFYGKTPLEVKKELNEAQEVSK